jgi:hypothetical protein
MWVLHAGKIIEFDGGFEEWDTVSAERAHAASVIAAEEEQHRLLAEKQRTRKVRDSEKEDLAVRRAARRKLEAAESRVAGLEQKVAALTAELEKPELYTTPDGGKRAATLGQQLDALKRELDQAFEQWAVAQGEAER